MKSQNKDICHCHYCHCIKPIGECNCKEIIIGCEHCGNPNESGWPKNRL